MSVSGKSRVQRALGGRRPPYYGGWCHIPGGFAAEIAGTAGFDWSCVDRQHGMIDEAAMFEMVRVLDLSGTPPLVRVSASDPFEIGRALDAGARGVIVPVIRSVADAERAADACRFAPVGTRSWATTRSKLRDPEPQPATYDDSVACVVMIETAGAVEVVAEIAAIPGVDGLFVGPSDLRLELGGEDARVTEACEAVVEACRVHDKIAGVFAGGPQRARRWLDRGFDLIALDSDSALLMQSLRGIIEATMNRNSKAQS